MAIRGRKPQTKQQLAAKGETRPSRVEHLATVLQFPVVSEVPDPPSWLTNTDATALWDELAEKLHAQKVLTEVDAHALGHLCQLHGSIVAGYRCSKPPTAADLSQLRLMFSEFGMTPSSRTRVRPAGDGKKDNPFSRNGKAGKA